MNRRRLTTVLITVAIGAAGATVALASTGIVRVGASVDPRDPHYTVSSGSEIPRASLSPRDQWILREVGANGPVVRIGSERGVAFYRMSRQNGGTCFAFQASFTTDPGLEVACLNGPDLDQPLVDMSRIVLDPSRESDGLVRLRVLQGIAADGVTAVGVIDANGDLHTTQVANNVYSASLDLTAASDAIRAIIALDERGSTIFAIPLNGS